MMAIQDRHTGIGGIVPPIDTSLEGAPGNNASKPYVPQEGGSEAGRPASSGGTNAPAGNGSQEGGRPAVGVQPGASSQDAAKVTAAPISTSVPAEYTASSYDELIPQIEKKVAEFKPLSEEELKKLRRRQKAEGIISGISDAVRSVANLVFTSKYAPNMYDPKDGMSAKAKARFEKEKAQRDADADKYFNYALTLGRLKDAEKQRGLQAWQTEQNLARQDRAFEATNARAQAEEDRKNEIHPLMLKKAESDANKAEVQALYAGAVEQSKVGLNKAKEGAANASAGASRARAHYYSHGGGSGTKEQDKQAAYDYWMSLTDNQKKQYRDMNKRVRKYNTAYDIYAGKNVTTPEYMDDDDDFIQHVWRQRKGWLKSHSKKQVSGFGKLQDGKTKIAGFGSKK